MISKLSYEERIVQAAAKLILKQVLNLLQGDPHQWSSRPCPTCRTISGIVGEPFGCVLHAQQKKRVQSADEAVDAALDEIGRDEHGY